MDLKKRLLSQKGLNLICLLSVILLPLLWALLTFDKLAVTSEGWYVVYSKMILDGQMPYRDFELAFPPLYAYTMTFVVSVFGESLIVFRVIGVFVFVGLAVLSYHIFKLIFPPWVSAIAALVTVFILQSENTFIGYDYIRFYDLFNYLAFFLLLRAVVRSYKKEPVNMDLHLLFAGTSCALAALLRQTSGAIVFVYFAVFLVLLYLFVKNVELKRRSLCYFFIGASVPVVITGLWLLLTGTLSPFIDMTIMSGTKGSMAAMLFGWVPRIFVFDIVIIIATIALAICLVTGFRGKNVDACPSDGGRGYLLFFIFVVSAAVSVVMILFFSLDISSLFVSNWHALLSPVFLLCLVLGLVILSNVITKIKRNESVSLCDVAYLFFCGFIFAVGFGSGTSGGLSFGQGAFSFGFITAIAFVKTGEISKKRFGDCLRVIAAIAIVFLFVAMPVSIKNVTPYEWWGLTAESYSEANSRTDISYFSGIRITADEKFVYEDFVRQTELYLGDGDEIYCYSQIGIFYILADRVPNVKAPIPWFDVSRGETLLEDLEYLQDSKPRMIVFGDHGTDVLDAHVGLFRDEKSGHRAMYDWLAECAEGKNGYECITEYSLHEYTIYLMFLSP